MDGSDWIALGALVVALCGVLVSIIALVFTRRDARDARADAKAARADADKAAERAERATAALEKHAAAAEQANKLARPPIGLQAVRLPSGKSTDTFRVYNYGTDVAHGVTVHKTDDGQGEDLPGGVDLGPDQATEPFHFWRSLQSRTVHNVLVSCDEWRAAKSLPLPSREQ